jgi:orotidine-5'-phosphate decarboxylase
MQPFSDRLLSRIEALNAPCAIGLDPHPEMMPPFVQFRDGAKAIFGFNQAVITAVADLVPAVKLQVAFYERFGVEGMRAFDASIAYAKERGLLVLVDAKRNDISSTAEAYADAYLNPSLGFNVDAITVSPFLGVDSLRPFVEACARFGRGIFILVKTSNPGSVDLQDRHLDDGRRVYETLAAMVDELGRDVMGTSGYSSIGAVVGATFPSEATVLRRLMPRALILVPGYGAQGGTAETAAANFDASGRGAIVNASRSVIYPSPPPTTRDAFVEAVRTSAAAMVSQVRVALASASS